MAKPTAIRGLSARSVLRSAGPRILAARLRDVERHEAGLPAEDAVHDMRVATRRLRAALRILRLRELDPAVKRLQDALGQVRDLQLQIGWLRGRDDGLAVGRMVLLEEALRALPAAVTAWRARTLPRLLDAQQERFKGTLGGHRVRKLLRKRLARLDERIAAALARPTAARMHAVRRSVKQVRYLLELAQPAFAPLAKRLLTELTPLQESLGQLHDVDVRIALLKDSPLLREQQEDRANLAAIVTAELARWRKTGDTIQI